jgi:hypothetical protein
VTRVLQPCGTQAAYQRHLAHHEVPCDACAMAQTHRSRFRYQPRHKPASARTDALFRELLDLITAECRRAGMLP